jgi:hypothetical protein
MACSCGGFCGAAGAQFSRKRAEKDLRQYHRKGPKATTRLLRDGLERSGLVQDASLIEVGAGIASLTFELLPLGVTRALVIDASPAYLAVAAEEASQRQVADVVRFVHADFAESAEPFPRASIIALDRVVCCYPSYRLLLEQAMRCADRAVALSYPRERWFVRAGVWFENVTRKTGFQTFVHPVDDMMRVIKHGGFEPVSSQSTVMWSADVFARRA